MQMTPELACLAVVAAATALMWVPYTVARIAKNGPLRAMGAPSSFLPENLAWAQRAKQAHANAVENLAVFAPLVLIAAALGVTTSATVIAAKVYLLARLVHYVVYSAGVAIVRTLAFLTGFGATIMFVIAIFEHAAIL
jgi:uncharacterized MAPEG superfamily protein